MTKRGRGRPRYEPNEKDRAIVNALTAAGVKQEVICKCLGSDPDGIDSKTLRKYYSREIGLAPTMVTAAAMAKLYSKIEQGHLGAICFWLKCKGGFIENLAITGKDGEPLNAPSAQVVVNVIQQELVGVPQEVRSRIAARLMALDAPGN